MPQPPLVGEAADELVMLYREAMDRLVAQYGRVIDGPRAVHQQARIRAMIRSVDIELRRLDAGASTWVQTRLPAIYAAAATEAANGIGASFAWTQIHTDAVQQLATTVWTNLLERTHLTAEETKRTLRNLARTETRASIIEGKTAVKGAIDLTRSAVQDGIASVTYVDGSVHSLFDWADTAVRTVSAEAYNTGTLTLLGSENVEWVEIFDGPGCQIGPGHDVGGYANGLVVPITDGAATDLSHPRCSRSFGGRPDITSAKEAKDAARFTPDEQRRAADIEAARVAAKGPRDGISRQRNPRTARIPRASVSG